MDGESLLILQKLVASVSPKEVALHVGRQRRKAAPIRSDSLNRLIKKSTWINDEAITAHAVFLNENEDYPVGNERRYVTNSFFYPKLDATGYTKGKLWRWFKVTITPSPLS